MEIILGGIHDTPFPSASLAFIDKNHLKTRLISEWLILPLGTDEIKDSPPVTDSLSSRVVYAFQRGSEKGTGELSTNVAPYESRRMAAA